MQDLRKGLIPVGPCMYCLYPARAHYSRSLPHSCGARPELDFCRVAWAVARQPGPRFLPSAMGCCQAKFNEGRERTQSRREAVNSRRAQKRNGRNVDALAVPVAASAVATCLSSNDGDACDTAAEAPQRDAARRREAAAAFYASKCRPGFKSVDDITAEELKVLLDAGEGGAGNGNSAVILVDCRAKKERDISIMAGAVARETFESDWSSMLDGKTDVVAYCTIGGRSGKFVKQFVAAHPRVEEKVRVRNFKCSLIDWLHVGGVVVDSGGHPTKRVHAWGASQVNFFPAGIETVL